MALWYSTRATGALSLVLLTASVVLGAVDVTRWSSPRAPRFVIDAIHRTTSLLVVAFVLVHVITAVLDSFAAIRLMDAVIPFASRYRPVWLGLGAVAFDLVLAIVATSLLRGRLGMRAWRAIHWLAYASWPVALVHGLGTGSDVRPGWMLWLSLVCIAAVAAAVLVRAASAAAPTRAFAGTAAALVVSGIGLLAWVPSGPLASGWSEKSGTPKKLLGGTSSARNSHAQQQRTTAPHRGASTR